MIKIKKKRDKMQTFTKNRLSSILSNCDSQNIENLLSSLNKQIVSIENSRFISSELKKEIIKIIKTLIFELSKENFSIDQYKKIKKLFLKFKDKDLILYSDLIIKILLKEDKDEVINDFNKIIVAKQKLYQFTNKIAFESELSKIDDLNFIKELLDDPTFKKYILSLFEQEFSYLNDEAELCDLYNLIENQIISNIYSKVHEKYNNRMNRKDNKQSEYFNDVKYELYNESCLKKQQLKNYKSR